MRTLDGTRGPDTARARRRQDCERGSESERWKERGVALRVFVYVFATHLFAGFIWILFYVGEHAKK